MDSAEMRVMCVGGSFIISCFFCVCVFARVDSSADGAADGDKQSLPRLENGRKYHLDIQRGPAPRCAELNINPLRSRSQISLACAKI